MGSAGSKSPVLVAAKAEVEKAKQTFLTTSGTLENAIAWEQAADKALAVAQNIVAEINNNTNIPAWARDALLKPAQDEVTALQNEAEEAAKWVAGQAVKATAPVELSARAQKAKVKAQREWDMMADQRQKDCDEGRPSCVLRGFSEVGRGGARGRFLSKRKATRMRLKKRASRSTRRRR